MTILLVVLCMLYGSGSVPLYWHQRSVRRGSLSYNPKPRVDGDIQTNMIAMGRHFDDMRRYYGFVTAVSLLEVHSCFPRS